MPKPSQSSRTRASAHLISRSEDETRALGERIGRLCEPGDVILLEGDLGAGKTVLAQGIARGLGVLGVVNSPTFTLVKEYRGRVPFYHFDLYRLEDTSEAADLGMDEYLDGEGVCVVEWAERATALWPADYLLASLAALTDSERRLDLDGYGKRGAILCAEIAEPSARGEPPMSDKHGAT
jgi:tRNA threonylcarbamoyladenosine biosynthesis protein TsaE